MNPHSLHILSLHKEFTYGVYLDNLNVIYKMNAEQTEIRVI
jgi:hypothetical protein